MNSEGQKVAVEHWKKLARNGSGEIAVKAAIELFLLRKTL